MRKATGYDNRGSNDFRPSRKDYKETTAVSQTAAVLNTAAMMYDCSDVEETAETHIIPRKSLTQKLHLKSFPQSIETEQVVIRQRDKISGKIVVTTNNRQVWKSDRSLLIQGTPKEVTTFKRVTSRSKRMTTEIGAFEPIAVEVPVSDILPDLNDK